MILSGGSLASWFAVVALVAYGLAAWPRRESSRLDAAALAVGWVAHGLALFVDIAGAGHGARLGFAPVLSLTVWLVLPLLPSSSLPAIVATSSRCTMPTSAWPGDSEPTTSAPSALSFTRAMKSRTTGSATSASSSAMRTSRSMSCTLSSVMRAWPRIVLTSRLSRSVRAEAMESAWREGAGRESTL